MTRNLHRLEAMLHRRMERLLHAPGTLEATSALVWDDLPDEADLLQLVGEGGEALRAGDRRFPRIRPLLVALAARAAGAAEVDPHLQHAAEVLQLSLLAHDLALGRSGGRRRRVARRILRRSAGVLGGHQLTLRALELARVASPDALGEMVDTLREISIAQALADELRDGGVPTRGDWLEHADGWTGAVFAFCCRGGAHLARAAAPEVAALGRYGRQLGRVWHVAEDVAALRRPEGGSLLVRRALSGRPVLPLVEVAAIQPSVGAAWRALVDDPDPDRATALAADVVRLGGVAAARRVVARESWSARRALQVLPPSPYREGLDRLARDLVRAAA